jgi:hypothetical protein
MKFSVLFCALALGAVLFAGCAPAALTPQAASEPTATVIPTQAAPVFTPTASQAPSATPAPSATKAAETPSPAPTTAIPTASSTPTASPVPTYAILRGVVIPDKVSCRYGPGAMYLYLYGMVKGATQDVIGRTDTGKWVLTRSRGDNKSCWVKTEYMDIKGEVMSLEMVYPDKFTLIQSNQGYRSPWDVAAVRSGDKVTISWKSEPLRAGDEESATSVLYVVETWVCQAGQLVFTPLGAYTAQVTVTDEAGCDQASHGRVFFSEKHGYAGPSEIPWPAAK